MEYIKEKLLDRFPNPVTLECTEKILNQMKHCVCKINNKKGKGTGFFCYIPVDDKKISVLITNNHVIDREILDQNNKIRVTINNDQKDIDINLKNRNKYTDQKYDITIIEIKKQDDLEVDYLEIDSKIFDNDKIYNESIYLLQYPKYFEMQKAAVSYGILREIQKNNIIHSCSTHSGSSGSPIICISNNKVIGIHKESSSSYNYNIGLFLKLPIYYFLRSSNLISEQNTNILSNNILNGSLDYNNTEQNNKIAGTPDPNYRRFEITDKADKCYNCDKLEEYNEINIILKIGKKDLNEDIYFIDNSYGNYYQNGKLVFHKHDNLKELNVSNTEVFIDDQKYKYTKFFNPDKQGIYEIKIKIKNDIKDMSFMFCDCKNITNIDLSKFNTKNVTDMSYLFTSCKKLEHLNLSSFNTKNVTDMSNMFDGCEKLKDLNLSSFDTKNIINMNAMFYGCENLTKINLSSFITKNANNMSNMFYNCRSLENLDLSNFNTINVLNMSYMFSYCKNLEFLDLSSFNTNDVININNIFYECFNLKSIKMKKEMNKKILNLLEQKIKIIEN